MCFKRDETINQSNGREFCLPYIGQCMPKDLSQSMYSIFTDEGDVDVDGYAIF